MKEFKHIFYNRNFAGIKACLDAVDDSWCFVKLVPVNEWETVAIFEREKELPLNNDHQDTKITGT